MQVSAPVRIETERLVLHGHTIDEFEPLAEMWADPAVVKHINGKPSTAQESWMRLLRYRGLWPLLGYGYWAVREKSSGRFAGDLGFADFHRRVEPSIEGVPEAGWVLAGWAQGQGFATEALRGALTWLDRQESHARSVCLITPDNISSIRVAEKNGFTLAGAVRGVEEETLLYLRERQS